jgi:glycosyltransferase involved in cell wall biosynthesis
MIAGHDIVVLSGMFHDDLWTSKQQISQILSRQNRLLFVEPYLTHITPFSRAELRPMWRRSLGKGFLRRVDRLHVYTPFPLFPFRHRSAFFQRLNDYLYVRSIKGVIHQLGFSPSLLYSFVYDTGGAIGQFREKVAIYHCADDWSKMPIPGKSQERVVELEAQLARKSTFVISASVKNANRLEQYNRHNYYIPNGVDFDLFSRAVTETHTLPDELSDMPRPRLIFIGSLDVWIDYALIEYVAQKRPEWSLILIGPAKTNVQQIKQYPNIYLLGRKERQLLPQYLHTADVALIPFQVNDLTSAVSPLKLYEYMAAGVPVVSTEMPEVRALHPTVRVATDYEEFLLHVENALHDNRQQRAELVEYAARSSWDARVEKISHLIEMFL